MRRASWARCTRSTPMESQHTRWCVDVSDSRGCEPGECGLGGLHLDAPDRAVRSGALLSLEAVCRLRRRVGRRFVCSPDLRHSGDYGVQRRRQPRLFESGGLYHYKDGRDFPDFIETIYDYPDRRMAGCRCICTATRTTTMADEGIAFFGSTGTMVVTGRTVTFTPQDVTPRFESYGWGGHDGGAARAGIGGVAGRASRTAARADAGRSWRATRCRRDITTPPITSPTSFAPSKRGSMWWRMKSLATTPRLAATWPTILTFTARWRHGMRRHKTIKG